MGNRLKYRLWSTEQKKMYDWYDCTKKGPNFIYGMFIDHRMLGKGCWCIQQCTGRKDKNGKLIFEEDFVIEKLDGFKDCKKVVYWIGETMTGFNLNSAGEYEVIGNIYENPELLEENNAQKIM